MPTEHAVKIRIYTFLSDVIPKGQAKTSALFLSEQYQKIRRYSSEHCSAYCSEHCSDRTAKTLILRRSRQRKSRNIFRLRRKISDKIMQQIPQVALTFDMTSGIITLI